ncbi:MAG: heme utilization cystosolic carrier protein HutX [Gammaproteobacteria bacterium]|nr:heme utilization cystosolic carrier protein HutX [Gammaproteobacteria bacterium]
MTIEPSALTAAVAALYASEPELMLADMAQRLGCSELEVASRLPAEVATLMPLTLIDELLESLPEWGPLTTIVASGGSIFEFKGDFPRGKYGHGYYNLYTKGEGLHGHLKIDGFAAMALISKPFRGTESHHFCFFGSNGSPVFKVYLGRDKARQLLPEQVAHFQRWRHAVSCVSTPLTAQECEPTEREQ